MPKFQFKAMNMTGRILEGIYEAPDRASVIEMIRQKNYYYLEIKELVERKDMKEIDLLSRIKARDLSIYCRQFASILRAGMPLIKCLSMLAEQTEKKSLKVITKSVREEVQKGSSLSQAMSLHGKKLPSILINMVAAGEASGSLDRSLEIMAEHFEKEHKTQQKVKSALRYPIIVLIVAVIVVVVMLAFVVPTFIGMFESAGARIPLLTRILIAMSNYVKKNGLLLLGVIISIILLFRLFLMQESGRMAFDRFKFKIPVLGKFLRKTIAVRFARTMSTLLSTGVSITEALEITGRIIGNAFARKGVDEVIEQVKEGKGLYLPMKSLMLFPPMLENMIMMGEETGTLDQMLHNSAEFYEEEVDRATQNLTSMIEPMIIVLMGGLVAFIVFAIALPMFDMSSLATRQ